MTTEERVLSWLRLEDAGLTFTTLWRVCGCSPEQLVPIVKELQADGTIYREHGLFKLADLEVA